MKRDLRYMAEILPIRRKTLFNRSINMKRDGGGGHKRLAVVTLLI